MGLGRSVGVWVCGGGFNFSGFGLQAESLVASVWDFCRVYGCWFKVLLLVTVGVDGCWFRLLLFVTFGVDWCLVLFC